jgi:hypothetical protein
MTIISENPHRLELLSIRKLDLLPPSDAREEWVL